MNKLNYITINKDNVEINEDMQYYLDYVSKITYPQEVQIVQDNDIKSIMIRTIEITNNDRYKIFVRFDTDGSFIEGTTTFFINNFKWTRDQFEFKKKIKKEIKYINNLHGTVKNLIDYMGGEYSRHSALNKLNEGVV